MAIASAPYNKCTGPDGTQLQRFYFQTQYPFAFTTLSAPNYPACMVNPHVCDMVMGVATVTKPTTATATDGAITVTATSTGSPIKYSLTNQPYSQMTNTSGSFTGLGVGDYVVYASDPYSCRATCPISITAPITAAVTYGVKYRQEYKDAQGKQTRVDLLEKGYSGAITDSISGGEPTELRLRGENGDFFDVILAGELVQNLTSITNFQYLTLYTADDRKYQTIYYKDLGSGLTEIWRGFITPVLHQEVYTNNTNYPVSLVSTDQLATLKDIDFLYDSGAKVIGTVSLLQIVALCLLKTDLGLPIRTAINIYESGQASTASDDPLAQTYVDALTYDGMTCADVLENVLGAFGATVRQWAGYWWIRRRAEETASINYREYSSTGVYVSSGSHTVTTTAWKWSGRSQKLEIIGSRGKIEINQDLRINPYYFTNGGFENDIVSGFTLVNNGNSSSFRIVSPGNQSGSAIQVLSDGVNSTYGSDAYLQFAARTLTLDGSEALKFSFDYFPESDKGTQVYPFIKFKASFRVGTYYLQGDGSWSTSNQWVEIVATGDQFFKWTTFEAEALAPTTGTTDTDLRIMTGQGPGYSPAGSTWYYANDASLQAVTTTTMQRGVIKVIYDETPISFLPTHSATRTRYYRLQYGTDPASGGTAPDVIHPTDYNAVTNTVIWKNITPGASFVAGEIDYTDTLQPVLIAGGNGYVRVFDNVALQVLPKGSQPPDKKTYTWTLSKANKKTYSKDLVNGDSPPEVLNGARSYTNVFTLSGGTATKSWKRKNVTEGQPLLYILGKQIAEQNFTPKFKLSGSMRGTGAFIGFNSCIQETSTGKYYSIAGLNIKDKQLMYDTELHEIVPEAANGVISEFNTSEFVLTEVGAGPPIRG